MTERDASEIRLGSVNFASRMLRGAIIVLMVLVPLSAVYAFIFGGIAGTANADILYFRDMRGMPGLPFTLPVPPPPRAFAPFPFGGPGAFIPRERAQRIVTTRCDEKDGVRTCTTTERNVPLDDAAPAPQPGSTTPSPPAVAPGFQPIAFEWIATPPDIVTEAPGAGAVLRTFDRPVMRGRLGGAMLLSVASLLLLLGVLYNFERMLAAFETGAVFSEPTVRLLQRAGVLVSAAAFLPQLDVYGLVRDSLVSVLTLTPMVPMAVGFPTNVNMALLLAGLFTILVARIVDEAVWLADEVRGTI
jgi:hypothetical protein